MERNTGLNNTDKDEAGPAAGNRNGTGSGGRPAPAGKAEELCGRMRRRWGKRIPGLIDGDAVRETAVTVPLVETEGELSLLFEVRSRALLSQPGEICFPGGAVEAGETPEQAAVRETAEELLIRAAQVELIAPLDELRTPANLTVRPFLAFLRDYGGTFSRAEVERVFTVPLSWFLEREPEIYEAKVMTVPGKDFPYGLIPGGSNYRWREGRYQVLFYRHENAVIWGMTAKIVRSLVGMCRFDQSLFDG